jgi:hypothetical protein
MSGGFERSVLSVRRGAWRQRFITVFGLWATRRLRAVQNGYDAIVDAHDFAGEGIASFVSECARASSGPHYASPEIVAVWGEAGQ